MPVKPRNINPNICNIYIYVFFDVEVTMSAGTYRFGVERAKFLEIFFDLTLPILSGYIVSHMRTNTNLE